MFSVLLLVPKLRKKQIFSYSKRRKKEMSWCKINECHRTMIQYIAHKHLITLLV